MVNPWVLLMTPWNVYSFGLSITAFWFPRSIFLQSSKELTTTARVLPSLIWYAEYLYCRHHFSQTEAWSSPSLRRCPNTGAAPGISGRPLICGISVEYATCVTQCVLSLAWKLSFWLQQRLLIKRSTFRYVQCVCEATYLVDKEYQGGEYQDRYRIRDIKAAFKMLRPPGIKGWSRRRWHLDIIVCVG